MKGPLKLWFFRDLSDDQRLKLFSLFSLPVDEIGKSHGRQEVALNHVTRKLVEMVVHETNSARAALEADLPHMEDGWQPIETAPMDGTELLGYGRAIRWGRAYAPGRHVCWWDEDGHWRGRDPDDTLELDLTHWMPLPAKPSITPNTGKEEGNV